MEAAFAVALRPRAPTARCTTCGTTALDALCHHCGSPLCSQHSARSIPDALGLHNPEFEGLGLDAATGTSAVHCAACLHWIRSFAWIRNAGLVLFALAAAGTALAWRQGWQPLWAGFVPVGLGALLAGAGQALQWTRYRRAFLASRPALPVLAQLAAVEVQETLAASAELDRAGVYTQRLGAAEGRLTALLRFTPQDKERVAAYRARYRLRAEQRLDFHAGYLVLGGAVQALDEEGAPLAPPPTNVLVLRGEVGAHEYFADPASNQNRWSVTQRHALEPEPGAEVVPVSVAPSLVPGEARRALELVLQLPGALPWAELGAPLAVEELVLELPEEQGQLDVVEPAAVLGAVRGADGERRQTLAWHSLTFSPEERASGRKCFYLRFREPVRAEQVLHGRVRLRLEGSYSALDDVRHFHCLGRAVVQGSVLQGSVLQGSRDAARLPGSVDMRRSTTLELAFRLSLAALVFHDTRADERKLVRDGVVPDGEVIGALVEALNARGVYLKRVIENPPRTSKAGAHITNRYWDLAGRAYDGLTALDFHLVLTGEEIHSGRSGRAGGRTTVELSVQGLEAEGGLEDRVRRLADELELLIEGVLERLCEREAVLTPLPRALDSGPRPGQREWAAPARAEPAASTRARLRQLDDALLTGRISQARYEEMRARLDQEEARDDELRETRAEEGLR